MTECSRIVAVEAVVQGVLKLTWADGYEGVVDLGGPMSRGKMFEPLADPVYFKAVRLGDQGHSIYWGRPDDEDVDFAAERLRDLAQQQAALLAQAS